jgi:hypothetical protein
MSSDEDEDAFLAPPTTKATKDGKQDKIAEDAGSGSGSGSESGSESESESESDSGGRHTARHWHACPIYGGDWWIRVK